MPLCVLIVGKELWAATAWFKSPPSSSCREGRDFASVVLSPPPPQPHLPAPPLLPCPRAAVLGGEQRAGRLRAGVQHRAVAGVVCVPVPGEGGQPGAAGRPDHGSGHQGGAGRPAVGGLCVCWGTLGEGGTGTVMVTAQVAQPQYSCPQYLTTPTHGTPDSSTFLHTCTHTCAHGSLFSFTVCVLTPPTHTYTPHPTSDRSSGWTPRAAPAAQPAGRRGRRTCSGRARWTQAGTWRA